MLFLGNVDDGPSHGAAFAARVREQVMANGVVSNRRTEWAFVLGMADGAVPYRRRSGACGLASFGGDSSTYQARLAARACGRFQCFFQAGAVFDGGETFNVDRQPSALPI